MKRWVSCPAEVTYFLIIPGQYEKCVAVLWFLFELHKFFAAHACLQPIAFVRSFMLWVLRLRRRGLPMSWGDNPGSISYSIYLTKWVTHDPSTAVRATTSLRGERAQQAAYSLPSPWAASRRERLRLCTQSACRFSLIAYRTSLQYSKYSCVSSARSEEKSAEASCAQSLCAAALLFSRALFSTTLPTLGENGQAKSFPRFHEKDFIP